MMAACLCSMLRLDPGSPARPGTSPARAKPRRGGSHVMGVKRSMADMEAALQHAAAAREIMKRARLEARRARAALALPQPGRHATPHPLDPPPPVCWLTQQGMLPGK